MQISQFGIRLMLLQVALVAALSAAIGAHIDMEDSELGIYRNEMEARITRDKMQQRIYRRDQGERGLPEGFYDARILKLEQRIRSNQAELDGLCN